MVQDGNLEQLKIIDFGIAANLWQETFVDGMKRAGTLKFMPPEMLVGANFNLDTRIDTWGLGVLLYYLFYLKYPFTGSDQESIK